MLDDLAVDGGLLSHLYAQYIDAFRQIVVQMPLGLLELGMVLCLDQLPPYIAELQSDLLRQAAQI